MTTKDDHPTLASEIIKHYETVDEALRLVKSLV